MMMDIDEMNDFANWFVQKAEEDSTVADFVTLFTLEFILNNLSISDRRVFVDLYAENYSEAFDFAESKIKHFEDRFTQALSQKIMIILAEGGEIDDTGIATLKFRG